ADDAPTSRASLRRLAKSLAREAAAAGADALGERARQAHEAAEAALPAAIRDLLTVAESWLGGGEANGGLEILLVEDDPGPAAMAAAFLGRMSNRVRVAADAADAESILRPQRVDLMVLDLVLPDRDGRDVLIQVRGDATTAELPVIVLSGQTSALARTESL